MAKLEIKGSGYSTHGLDIRIDGQKISGLKGLNLYLEAGTANEMEIKVGVDDIDIDVEAHAILEAFANKNKQ